VYLANRLGTSLDWWTQQKIPTTARAFNVLLGVVQGLANPHYVLEDELLGSTSPPVKQHLSAIVWLTAVFITPTIFAHVAATAPAVFIAPFVKGTPFSMGPKIGQKPLHSLI
jgi:hypothetical protein